MSQPDVNTPREPGWYWLRSASGPRRTKPHYEEIVRVYRDDKERLVYFRSGYCTVRPVTEFPDGAPGWSWGKQIPPTL
jgi:hypothetical protein